MDFRPDPVKLFPLAIFCVGLTLGAAALAEPAQQQGPRVSQVIVYGSDACPRGDDDEIVVCARKPEYDRLRIPGNLREAPPDPEGESWAARAESLEYVGRTGIQSCSTVGPGGFTGCWEQMIRQAQDERRAGVVAAP